MLLSIILMIKNEEKYLEKTLKALDTIREKINSELIILDTGSIDKSVEIAKKYTDKVYFEKWNSNFAEMRNKSISYAKGDWILILDADEELIECEKIINFFNTDLYKMYNCASIELRNINSEDCKSYSTSLNLRLFKNEEFRYEGAIHEQPMYKEPIYNNVAVFNHYGYLYIDEEFRQNKLKRNEKILLNEIKKNPENPYINFQLAKNYLSINEKLEALYYMEKSMELYRKYKNIPEYAYSNLARLYIDLDQFDKCEKICIEYLQKKDDKNIDIYYFLAVSQIFLKKYIESLKNYEKYIYLVDNYDISTQANSIYADGITVGLRKYAQMGIIRAHYYLKEYKEVIEKVKNIDFEEVRDIYEVIFDSLYKSNKLDEILNIYIKNISSKVEIKNIEYSLESMILKTKESDKNKIYKVLSNIDNNYGLLNKVRIGEKFKLKDLNLLLLDSKQAYYGDVIYYSIKSNLDILELLQNISYPYMKNYFDYIINHKRDSIPKLYEILSKVPNTLKISQLNIYSCLSKALLIDNSFYDDRYKEIFYMYITYRYNFIKQVYNSNLSDEEIIYLLKDKEDEFVVKINLIQQLKDKDPLSYVRGIKDLILDNEQYKKAIEILMSEFSQSIDENEELKKLKKQYKNIIENSINNGELNQALSLIDEYKTISKEDIDIKNMQGIIHILKNEYEEAELILKQAFMLDSANINTLFNIAYLKEVKLEKDEAIAYYKNIISISSDEEIVLESTNKINELKKLKYIEII